MPSNLREVLQWVCAQETHLDGALHYHMAVKLHQRRRWLQVRIFWEQENGIRVHFSSTHCNYYSACKYVTKEDVAFFQSEGHPDLANALPPRTAQASQAQAASGEPKDGHACLTRQRTSRLTAYEVSQIAVSRGIKSRLELAVGPRTLTKTEGKTDLAEFIINRGQKVVECAIQVYCFCVNLCFFSHPFIQPSFNPSIHSSLPPYPPSLPPFLSFFYFHPIRALFIYLIFQEGWEMETAQETLQRSQMSRLDPSLNNFAIVLTVRFQLLGHNMDPILPLFVSSNI